MTTLQMKKQRKKNLPIITRCYCRLLMLVCERVLCCAQKNGFWNIQSVRLLFVFLLTTVDTFRLLFVFLWTAVDVAGNFGSADCLFHFSLNNPTHPELYYLAMTSNTNNKKRKGDTTEAKTWKSKVSVYT